MITKNPEAFWKGISERDNWRDYILPGRSYDEFDAEGKLQAEAILPYAAKTGTVIDYGCGIGRVAKYFQPHTERMIGLDICDRFISIAEAPDFIEYHNTQSFKETAIADFIYCVSVLQHNTEENREAIMSHIYELLKPGGTCFVTLAYGDIYKEGDFVHKFTEEEAHYLASPFSEHRIEKGNVVRYRERAVKPGEVNELFLIAKK